MIVSCVYVCRKPARRKIKTMSVEVQTDDNIEIYLKDTHTSSSPTSSPPLERGLERERQKLMRPLSEVRPAFVRQVSASETRNHIPPSPLTTSDLATSICSLQSATSSHLRNHRKLLKKSTTMVAFPSNTLQNILTSDSYRKLASNNTISTAVDAADPLNRRRRITVATQPGLNLNHTNSSHNLTSHNITLVNTWAWKYIAIFVGQQKTLNIIAGSTSFCLQIYLQTNQWSIFNFRLQPVREIVSKKKGSYAICDEAGRLDAFNVK
ncbi:uncharacterized protein LOC134814595 [Bolinopsis microptera]|uniref:uncharacterized protein LOC134814595 n=1 Tax=Bolinopsis microptera TaxID=2820187 RepID=UPI0030799713